MPPETLPSTTPHGQPARTAMVIGLLLVVAGVESAAVVAFNVVIDPYGQFGTDLLAPLSLEDPTLLNSVDLKVYQYDRLDPPPKLVILGSSRSETIDPRDFAELGHPPGYNFALPANRAPENVLAVYRYLVEGGAPPTEVYYGIEWTHFQDWATPLDQIWSSPELGPHLDGLWPNHKSLPGKLRETFSVSYLRDSLRWIGYHTVLEPDAPWYFDRLGVFHDHAAEQALAAGELDARDQVAELLAAGDPEVEAVQPYAPPGPVKTAVLGRFVDEALAQGTEVTFFFTPIHPALLSRLQANGFEEGHAAEIATLTDHCGPGVRVFDLTETSSFQGDPRHFTGPTHYLAPNARRIVETIHEGAGDLCRASQDGVA